MRVRDITFFHGGARAMIIRSRDRGRGRFGNTRARPGSRVIYNLLPGVRVMCVRKNVTCCAGVRGRWERVIVGVWALAPEAFLAWILYMQILGQIDHKRKIYLFSIIFSISEAPQMPAEWWRHGKRALSKPYGIRVSLNYTIDRAFCARPRKVFFQP